VKLQRRGASLEKESVSSRILSSVGLFKDDAHILLFAGVLREFAVEAPDKPADGNQRILNFVADGATTSPREAAFPTG